MQAYEFDRPERAEIAGPRPLVEKRPHFGRYQVRTLRGVKFGARYKMIKGSDTISDIIIVKEPYQNSEGRWRFDYKLPGRDNVTSTSCADNGLVPYEGGKWNPNNWLRRT